MFYIVSAWVLIPPSKLQPSNFLCVIEFRCRTKNESRLSLQSLILFYKAFFVNIHSKPQARMEGLATVLNPGVHSN